MKEALGNCKICGVALTPENDCGGDCSRCVAIAEGRPVPPLPGTDLHALIAIVGYHFNQGDRRAAGKCLSNNAALSVRLIEATEPNVNDIVDNGFRYYIEGV